LVLLRKVGLVFVFMLGALILGCSQEKSQPLVVPSEYEHAKDMLDHLTTAGLKIEDINNSKYTAFFNTNPSYSMYIRTNLGVFELVHLEHKNGKDIDIVEKEASGDGNFKYIVSEHGEERLEILGIENYFNKTDEYITIARDKKLNHKIKQALDAL